MREIQVPGSYPAHNLPAQRWSLEMDEDQAIKELQAQSSEEDVREFVRGESRGNVIAMANRRIQTLIKG